MCEKIESGGKIFFYLNHQTLINKAYRTNENENYELRSELFEYKDKTKDFENVRKRKRKSKQMQTLEENEENIPDADLLLICDSIKSQLQSYLVKYNISGTEMPRVWEELQSNDFPKFNGANNTNSFHFIDNLVKGKCFLIPPNTCFYNHDIAELQNYVSESMKFDLLILDPPWRNKYIRRLKRHNIGYNMLENNNLQELPIRHLLHENSVVAIWCTNSKQHQQALLNDFLPAWNLRLLHTVKWLKFNTQLKLVKTPSKNLEQKQPYEHLFIACHRDATTGFGLAIKEVEFILSVPSLVNSHKPPLLSWFQVYFNSLKKDPKCIELFARYLHPNFTCFGLEVLKLMDCRLYKKICSK